MTISSDSSFDSQQDPDPQVPKFIVKLANLLVQHHLLFLLFGVILSLASIVPAQYLTLDQSIESLYAPTDPKLLNHLESKELFGGDEFLMVVWKQENLLEEDGEFEDDEPEDEELDDDEENFEEEVSVLESIREFANQLGDIPGIAKESTKSLTNMLEPEETSFLTRLFLKTPAARERLLNFSRSILIGDDNETTAIILRLDPEEKQTVSREVTFTKVRELAEQHDPPAFVVGEPIQLHDMFTYVQEDGVLLGAFSTGILLFVIMILFRSFRWMVLPILVVHTSLIITKAILALSGIQLSMVSSMLNSLITIIAIATVMHITVVFREMRKTYSREESFRRTFHQLALPIFWTCLTTSIGFAALMSSEIHPVESFGLMMTIGTFLVLLTTMFLIPGGILIGKFCPDPLDAPFEKRWGTFLSHVANTVMKHPKFWLAGSMALFLFSLVGFQFLRIETDFSRNFRDSSPIVQSLNFVENNLGGAGTWEVMFDAPEELNDEFLESVDRLAEKIRAIPAGASNDSISGNQSASNPITKAVALTDGLNLPPPIFAKSLEKQRAFLEKYQPEFEPSLYASDKKRMRIVLRALERQPSESKIALIEHVEKLAEEEFDNVHCTGLFVMLAYIIQSLLSDQLTSFILAALGIGLTMAIAFRSFKIGLISMVPNIFPIVVLVGLLGWFDVALNIGTAMIASVSLGLTVDSSIHYLAGYMRLRKEGFSCDEAVMQTHGEVGKALVFANITLICGFLILTFSNFIPLVYFGILVSIAMLGGLFGNLILLPILMQSLHVYRCDEQEQNLEPVTANQVS